MSSMNNEFWKKLEQSKIIRLEGFATEEPAKFYLRKDAVGNVDIEYAGTSVDIADVISMGIEQILKDNPESGRTYAIRMNKILNAIYERDPLVEQAIKLVERSRTDKKEV